MSVHNIYIFKSFQFNAVHVLLQNTYTCAKLCYIFISSCVFMHMHDLLYILLLYAAKQIMFVGNVVKWAGQLSMGGYK